MPGGSEDWLKTGRGFLPHSWIFSFLWRFWHNVGNNSYSECCTFILSLMKQAPGHEAVPMLLKESWHEWHPFLSKAKCLQGVGQLYLQQACCVSPCVHSGPEGDCSSMCIFQMQRWSSLRRGSCRDRQAVLLQASPLPQPSLQDLHFFQFPWTAAYPVLWG